MTGPRPTPDPGHWWLPWCVHGLLFVALTGLATCTPRGPVEQEVALPAGQELRLDVRAGEAHHLFFTADAGEYLHLLVKQDGVDVEVFLDGPGGNLLYEGDTPSGRTGTEEVFLVAAEKGLHTLRLVPFGHDAAGRLTVEVRERRPASGADRLRARARTAQARALRRSLLDEHEAAVAAYQQALPLLEADGEDELWAQSNWHLGETLAAAGRLREAAEQLQRSLAIFEERGDLLGQARAATDLGGVLHSLGDLQGAEKIFQRSLALYREVDVPQGVATALHNLGLVKASRADYAAALDLYQQSLDAWRRLHRPRAEATTLLSMGSVYARIGRDAEALGFAQQALASLPASAIEERQHALVELSWVHLLTGDAETALAGFAEALELARSRNDLAGEAAILGRRSSALRDLGRPDEALADSRRALELARAMGNRRSAGHTLINLGSLETEAGNLPTARRHLSEAVDLLTATGDTNGAVAAHVELARANRRLNNLAAARDHLLTAMRLVEQVRSTVPGDLSRSHFLADRYDVFEELASVDLELYRQTGEQQHALRGLETAERGRARTLLEGLATASGQGKEREAALAEIRALEGRRMQLVQRGGPASEIKGLEALIQILALDAERRSGPAGTVGVQPLDVTGMQALLDGDTILLVYLLSEPESILWTVSRDDVQVHRLAGRTEIEERARDAVTQLRHRRVGKRSLQTELTVRDLSRLLLAPAAERIAAFPRLVVLADGALHAVPFAALPVPGGGDGVGDDVGEILLDRHEVVYLPSTTVLAWQRQRLARRSLAPRPLAMVADAVYRASDPRLTGEATEPVLTADLSRALDALDLEVLEELPYSTEEARSILAMVPEGKPLAALGFAANRQRVLSGDLSEYRVVHFATHGLLHPNHPQLSGLVLSLYDEEGHPVDGFLRAHEIAALNLPAELVVLSACKTGLGREIRGEGMVGLSHAFFRAGARRLVLSLWNVDDRATADLMTRFYRHLWRGGLPAGQALRRAQLEVRAEERWREPYYWAAFTLQGDWE